MNRVGQSMWLGRQGFAARQQAKPDRLRISAAGVLVGALGLLVGTQAARAETPTADPAPSPAFETKLHELMQASGAAAHLQQQIDAAVTRAQGDAERMLRETAARLQPDADYQQRFAQALDQYLTRVRARLSAVARGESWLALYRKSFSEAEIDQLLAFYRSPLHARESAAAEDAGVRLDGEVTQQFNAQTGPPMRDYLGSLRSLARACQCERPAPAGGANPASTRLQSPPAAGDSGSSAPVKTTAP